MPDYKPILAYLGIEESDISSLDTFKKKFDEKYVNVDTISERKELYEPYLNSAIGAVKGGIENSLKRAAKAEGIEFKKEDFDGKKTEEFAPIIVGKLKAKYEGEINELKEKVGKNSDEVVKGWETKYNDLSKKLSDKESLLQETVQKYEGLQNETGTKIKSFQISYAKKDAIGKLNLRSDVKEIEKAGFNAIIENNYDLDFDEKEGLIVRDKKGKRVSDEKQSGKFKSFDQILQEHAEKEGLLPKNPHAAKSNTMNFNLPLNGNGNHQQAANGNNNNAPTRRVSARIKI